MEIITNGYTYRLRGLPMIREPGPFLENPGNFKILNQNLGNESARPS